MRNFIALGLHSWTLFPLMGSVYCASPATSQQHVFFSDAGCGYGQVEMVDEEDGTPRFHLFIIFINIS